MKFVSILAASLILAGTVSGQTPGKTHLKVGDMAPAFTLPSTTGKPVSLAELRGKTVVLAFFPAAFTGGCTKEVQAYRDHLAKFQEAGAEVFLVSTDNLPTLQHWAGEIGASYAMLSDFMRKASRDYGVLIEERGIASRTTFVIDGEGRIQHIEEGSAAIDPTGALNACTRLKKS
jgi:peroxiredoxin